MSIRIRISYETEPELELVQELLGKHVAKLRKASKQTGKYKQAYADILTERKEVSHDLL